MTTTGNRTQVPAEAKDQLHACVSKVAETYHQAVTYQPSSRYRLFQWYEFGIFFAAALLLAGICVWSIRRRRS